MTTTTNRPNPHKIRGLRTYGQADILGHFLGHVREGGSLGHTDSAYIEALSMSVTAHDA
jgi:hypothetical protein